MTPNGRLAALASGLVLALGCSALADKPAPPAPASDGVKAGVDLSPKFSKGDVSSYDFVFTSSRTNAVADGAAASQVFKQAGRVVRRVLRADEQGATISLTYERVTVDVSGGPMALKFDSATPPAEDPDNPFVKSLRVTVGAPVTVRLDKDGQIESIEGNQAPAPAPESPKPPPVQPAQTLVSDTMIRRSLLPLYTLPGGPKTVATGGTWKNSVDTAQPPVGIFTAETTYTLRGVEAGVADVGISGTVKLSPAVGSSAVDVTLTDHAISGQIRWDTARGLLREYADRQLVKLKGPDNTGVMRTLDSEVSAKFTLVEPASDAKPAAPAK